MTSERLLVLLFLCLGATEAAQAQTPFKATRVLDRESRLLNSDPARPIAALPLLLWGPWRSDEPGLVMLSEVEQAAASLLRIETVLDILRSFTVFATDKKHRKIKVICRYQQYEAVNRIVERVVAGKTKKGLIWHFQGSGKSLLMVFAAQKLRSR